MGRAANKTKYELATPAIRIWGNVVNFMYVADFSKEDVSKALGYTLATFYARQKEPEALTIGELQRLSSLLGVPFSKLVTIDE